MKKFYICSVEKLGYWIDERYLGRFCPRRPCLWRDSIFHILDPDLPAGWGRAWVVGDVAELRLGARRYELSDWLGNVRVVVADRRLPMQAQERPLTGLLRGIVYRKVQEEKYERLRDGNLQN